MIQWKAVETLIKDELPTRKTEDWKYADLSFLKQASLAKSTTENSVVWDSTRKRVVVFLKNTSTEAQWNLPQSHPGLQIQTQKTPLAEDTFSNNFFQKMIRASDVNHLTISLSKDFPADYILEIQHQPPSQQQDPSTHLTHLQIQVEKGAEVYLLQDLDLQTGFYLSGLDVQVEETARLTLLTLEKGINTSRSGHNVRFHVAKNASVHLATLTQGAQWSRHNVYAELCGEGAEVRLEAAYLHKNKEFVDHHTTIDHRVGHTLSSQKYNGVLSDQAKAVFNGRVCIRPQAQKASAAQLNKNLLLSKTAEVNTKPELQIDADDVQAKHGATVGQLSPEQLFYLTSRGIAEDKARQMLTRGFVEEVGLALPENLKSIFFERLSLGEELETVDVH